MSRVKCLATYVAGYAVPAFNWEAANCCHFAAGWVLAVRGVDPMAGLPATPTAAAAARLIKRLGGSLEAAWTRQLGQAPIPPSFAQVGDLVLVPTAEGPAIGICNGMDALCTPGAGGVPGATVVCMSLALAAWRV